MISYDELKTCPIGIYKLNELYKYVLKWNYILDNPKTFLVKKWIEETDEYYSFELLQWLKKHDLHTNKKFLYGLVDIFNP